LRRGCQNLGGIVKEISPALVIDMVYTMRERGVYTWENILNHICWWTVSGTVWAGVEEGTEKGKV
jgi:hypothetical protein